MSDSIFQIWNNGHTHPDTFKFNPRKGRQLPIADLTQPENAKRASDDPACRLEQTTPLRV